MQDEQPPADPQDDAWIATALGAPASRDVCVQMPVEFDAGRIMAWQRGAEDAEVVAHLGACAFCRDLLDGLAKPLTDAQTRAMADQMPSPRRWAAPLVTVLACAAALVIWAARPDVILPLDALTPTQPSLGYTEATFAGGLAEVKSTTGSTRFTETSTLRWVLRPPSAAVRAQSAALYRVDGARLVAVPAQVTVRPTGAVRLELRDVGLLLPAGRVHLIAVTSLGEALDLTGHFADRLDRLPGVSVIRREITVGPASK